MLLVVVVVGVFICCLQENARVVALYEGKLKVLEAREHALLYQERDVSAKEDELSRREESLKIRGRESTIRCAQIWRLSVGHSGGNSDFSTRYLLFCCCVPNLCL